MVGQDANQNYLSYGPQGLLVSKRAGTLQTCPRQTGFWGMVRMKTLRQPKKSVKSSARSTSNEATTTQRKLVVVGGLEWLAPTAMPVSFTHGHQVNRRRQAVRLTLCVYVCLAFALCVYVCLAFALCVYVCQAFALCVYVCLAFALCMYVRLAFALCAYVRLAFALFVYVC